MPPARCHPMVLPTVPSRRIWRLRQNQGSAEQSFLKAIQRNLAALLRFTHFDFDASIRNGQFRRCGLLATLARMEPRRSWLACRRAYQHLLHHLGAWVLRIIDDSLNHRFKFFEHLILVLLSFRAHLLAPTGSIAARPLLRSVVVSPYALCIFRAEPKRAMIVYKTLTFSKASR